MPENYEVTYTHPGGATATFIREDGELDALAKGLDSEQFWVFKNVKSLLVRNDEDDLREANRLMASVGFAHNVRIITAPRPADVVALEREAAFAGVEEHGHSGIHLPSPSFWPMLLGISIFITLVGLIAIELTLAITAIGAVLVFISMVSWGLEPA